MYLRREPSKQDQAIAMSKLFRKMRQGLISKGNKKDYLLYAIGEIFLVVIGILIALQINNWNNQKVANKRNIKLLEKLASDLELDANRAVFLAVGNDPNTIDGYGHRVKTTDSILHFLEHGFDEDELSFMVESEYYWFNDFNLNQSTFEQMKNTGVLYSVASDTLIQHILLYYKLCERESFYNRTYSKDVVTLKDKCSNGWFDFKFHFKRNPKKAKEVHSWLKNPHSEQFKNFRNYMMEVHDNSNLMKNKLLEIEKQAKKLKAAIQDELSRT